MIRSAAAALLTALAACSDSTQPAPPAAPAALIAPDSITVLEGDSIIVEVHLVDSTGARLPAAPVAWVSGDTTIAVVNPAGLVGFRRPGRTVIGALSAGYSAAIATHAVVRFVFSASGAAYRSYVRWCGVTDGDALYCLDSQGYTPAANELEKIMLPLGAGPLRQLSVGNEFMCAVTASHRAFCWGAWQDGQLGGFVRPAGYLVETPVEVLGGQAFVAVSASARHACGLTADSAAYCWGTGTLGDSTDWRSDSPPVRVAGGLKFVVIAAGGTHTCALTPTDEIVCWGDNYSGQLGRGSDTSHVAIAPVPVSSAVRFISVAAGDTKTCALGADHLAYCWGREVYDSTVRTPTAVDTTLQFQSVDMRGGHACGLTVGGPLYCWGGNASGELGNGTTTLSLSPVLAATGFTFARISVGYSHTCGSDASGVVYCWGAYFGLTPVRIRDQP